MSAYTATPLPHRRTRVRFTSCAPTPTTTTSPSTDASDLSSSNSEISSSSEEPSDESSGEDSDEERGDTDMEGDDTPIITTTPTTTTTNTAHPAQTRAGVTNLRANRGTKPAFKLGDEHLGPDIRAFLKDFLPQLKAANEELEAQKRAGTLRCLDAEEPQAEGAPYIEMELGLGVLEARGEDGSGSADSGENGAEEGGEVVEGDVLGSLLGRGRKGDVGIEVVVEEGVKR